MGMASFISAKTRRFRPVLPTGVRPWNHALQCPIPSAGSRPRDTLLGTLHHPAQWQPGPLFFIVPRNYRTHAARVTKGSCSTALADGPAFSNRNTRYIRRDCMDTGKSVVQNLVARGGRNGLQRTKLAIEQVLVFNQRFEPKA